MTLDVISSDDWRRAGAMWSWRGRRIFTRVDGRGDPLVLIHGFPTASWDWWRLWPELTARYRVITLDMLGFGWSEKPAHADYTIAAQADLIEALLAREQVTHFRLLAHDYGVTVAQELLARQLERAQPRITATCLLNGGLFPETHRALPSQRLLASPIGPLIARLSSYRMYAANMRRIWGATPLPDAELVAMWQLTTASNGLAVLPKLLGYMRERRRHRARWAPALDRTTAPLRIINGLVDPVSGAHMVARYRQLVAMPDILELPGVGHYPQLEAPAQVLAGALELFERVSI